MQSHFYSSFRSLHTMIPQITSSSVKIVYLQISYLGLNSYDALSTALITLRLVQHEYWLTTLSSYRNCKRSRNLAISLLRGIVIMTVVLPRRSHSCFIDHSEV
jgi:hypothetical protein